MLCFTGCYGSSTNTCCSVTTPKHSFMFPSEEMPSLLLWKMARGKDLLNWGDEGRTIHFLNLIGISLHKNTCSFVVVFPKEIITLCIIPHSKACLYLFFVLRISLAIYGRLKGGLVGHVIPALVFVFSLPPWECSGSIHMKNSHSTFIQKADSSDLLPQGRKTVGTGCVLVAGSYHFRLLRN